MDVSEVETETETGGETSGEMGSNYTCLRTLYLRAYPFV